VKILFGEKLSNWGEVCLYFELKDALTGKSPSVWNSKAGGDSPPREPLRKEEHELLIASLDEFI
jgi:hypothetical protein